MKRTTFDKYIRLHRLMWLHMSQTIAETHHTVDPYYYKKSWCERTSLFVINNCFACKCATELWEEANGDYSKILGYDTMCGYCPLDWHSTGDFNGEYMCEYCYDNDDLNHYGLWMIATDINSLFESYCLDDPNQKLSKHDIKIMNKLWKKQCKICYKIAMLPIREEVENLTIESL